MLDTPHPSRFSQSAAIGLAALVIVAAGTIVYLNSLHAAFVLDDLRAIKHNPSIRQMLPLSKFFHPPAAMSFSGRPLVYFTFAVNMALDQHLFRGRLPPGPVRVVGFHLFNLVVHLLAGLTLFGVVRRTFAYHVAGQADSALWMALLSALLWTVHPLLTESVTYTVERTESMCGLFYLLTLYCVIRGAESSSWRRSWTWYGASFLACLAGMASKEVMVSAPVIVAAYDRIFLSASWREVWRRRGGLYLGVAATWLLLVGLMVSAGSRGQSAGFGGDMTAWQYAQTQFGVIVHYLWLCFWPRSLLFDYGDRLASGPAEVWPYAAVIAALVAATIVALWRWPRLGFAGLAFFALLSPTSSFVPLITQTAAEHRMYLALAAVIVEVVALVHLLWRQTAPHAAAVKWFAATVASVILVLLGWQTVARNRDYATPYRLWKDTVRKNPDSARAHRGLCQALLAEGLPRPAIQEATAALELREEPLAHLNRGTAYLAIGQPEKALADFNDAVRLDASDAMGWYNRGLAEAQLNDLEAALDDFRQALALRPEFSAAWLNRGVSYAVRDELALAEHDFDHVIQLEPHAADAYLYRADVRFRQKHFEPAWDDLQMAEKLGVTVDPEFRRRVQESFPACKEPSSNEQ
ncbi:MAG: hypothetical protein B7Z73_02565 [Planctomycetia bacterium 21-64-5]|nr:MAG: hypothetical protein B7Z73_02565 [Planctomycetia bacterium 21-64-5]